jgi:hypothetical protein
MIGGFFIAFFDYCNAPVDNFPVLRHVDFEGTRAYPADRD